MKVMEVIADARDALTVRRVYGEPYEMDGLTVIPAATMSGGAGGGAGHDEKGQEGEGVGFGITARPAGVIVIKNGEVSWQPAVDVNRIVAVVGLAAIVYVLSRPRLARAKSAGT